MSAATHHGLKKFCEKCDVLETEKGTEERLSVLRSLQSCLDDWLKVLMATKYSDVEVHGTLHLFGSFPLGINSKGGDIDCLAVIDHSLDANDIFDSFYDFVLSKLNPTSSRSVRTAFVPLLFFVIDQVEVDLLFVGDERFREREINPHDDDLLESLDHATILRLNGCRETMLIKELTPNFEAFKLATIAAKLWAKKKLLYGETLGSLPGVALCVMMSRVCRQEVESSTPEQLLHSFFSTYDSWDWSKPVMLRPLSKNHLDLDQWNPGVRRTDSLHAMKVITPIYPEKNITFLVNPGTLCRLKDQLSKARLVCSECMKGTRDWADIFIPSTQALSKFKNILMVEAMVENQDNPSDWLSLVDSRLRVLPERISKNPGVQDCWLLPKHFPQVSADVVCWRWFVGIMPSEEAVSHRSKLDLSSDIQNFLSVVKAKSQDADKAHEENSLSVKAIKHSSIGKYVEEDMLKMLI